MSEPVKDDALRIVGDERPRVMRFSYSAGPVRSKFLLSLRDRQKIWGRDVAVAVESMSLPDRPALSALRI